MYSRLLALLWGTVATTQNKHTISADLRPRDHHVDVRAEVLVPAPGGARGLDGTGVGLRGVARLAHISALLFMVHSEVSYETR